MSCRAVINLIFQSDDVRFAFFSQRAIQHETIASQQAAGHPPLGSVSEKQRADKLDDHQRDEQQCHSSTGAGHDVPSAFEFAGLDLPLVAT